MRLFGNISIFGLLFALFANQLQLGNSGVTNGGDTAKSVAKILASFAPPGVSALLEGVLQIAIIGIDKEYQDDGSAARHEELMVKIDERTDELKQLVHDEAGKVINKIVFDHALRSIVHNTIHQLDDFKRSYKNDFIGCIIKKKCDAETRKNLRDNWLQPRSRDRVALSTTINNFIIRNGSHDSDFRVFDVIRQAHKIAMADYADCDLSESVRGAIDRMHDFMSGVVIQVYQSIIYMYVEKYKELKKTDASDAEKILLAVEDVAKKFKEDVKSINAARKIALVGMPRDIRRCQLANQKKGVTYDRLTRFVQALLVRSKFLTHEGNSISTTTKLTSDTTEVCNWGGPFECSPFLPLYNCTYIFRVLDRVYLEPENSLNGERIYHHFQGAHVGFARYGKQTGDSIEYPNLQNQQRLEWLRERSADPLPNYLREPHTYDLCWVDRTNDPKSVRKFSIAPVKASDGFVVTGVRLNVTDTIVFLQIHEAKLINGTVDPKTARWKKIKEDSKNYRIVRLDINHRKLILGDYKVPDGTLLTGVGFNFSERHGSLMLTVYNQKVDQFGNLLGSPHIAHSQADSLEAEHSKNRLEISMKNPVGSELAPATSRHLVMNTTGESYFVRFQPSDLDKDAGQTTVPYLDIQDVVTNPPVPLIGFGAYYSGLEGFGGFVGLKIFTADDLNAFNDTKIDRSFKPILDTLSAMKSNTKKLPKKNKKN